MAPLAPLAALAALLCGPARAAGPAGAAPEAAARYASEANGGSFECFDGSAVLPAGSVNDDFCDCADGSDEPGTAACAGRPGAHFYCGNAGSVPRLLYASRVRDGVCDCCDGSDEAAGRCPDTCEAEGKELQAERERRRTSLVDGLRVLKESEDKAKASAATWREERDVLAQELPALEAAEAAAQASADAARKVADEARQAQAAADVARSSSALLEDFEGAEAEDRWSRAVGGSFRIVDDPKGERGKVLAMGACTWGGDAFSSQDLLCSPESKCKISYWARGAPWQGFSRGTRRTEEPREDAHSWLAVPAANPDFADRLLSTQSSDDWTFYEYEFPQQDNFQMFGADDVLFSSSKLHIMLQAHDSTGHCSSTMFDDFRVWKDNVVVFFDADGDKVELKINDAGGMDVYANGERMAENVADFSTEGLYILFGGFRAQAPSQDVVERCDALYRGRPAAPQQPAEAPAGSTESESEEEREAPPDEPAESPKTPEVSEYAKWALGQESEEAAEPTPAPSEEPPEPTSASGPNWNRVQSKRAPAGDSEVERALRAAEDALEEAKKKAKEQRDKRDGLDHKLKQLEENPRWFSLSDACVEKRIDQYTYTICFFGEATQDHVSLGTFKEWEPGAASVLLFENGQYCHGGPARSLRLQLLCGSEGSLSDVSEPSRCSYAAEAVHPSACREEDLLALEEPVNSKVLRPHEEL